MNNSGRLMFSSDVASGLFPSSINLYIVLLNWRKTYWRKYTFARQKSGVLHPRKAWKNGNA